MPNCKSCHAEIEFVETKNGKQMPMDMSLSECPTCDGIGFVVDDEVCTRCVDGKVRLSHFVTCPNAAEHRR